MGLAPVVVEAIFETIQKLNAAGITILLVEQNAAMALSIAHRGYVLETGTVVLEGSGNELLTNERVRKTYLGEA
jgi:branched-chain amino acid transport system ATP-binding protein